MSLKVENLEHNMAKLTIEVSAEEFEEAIKHAYVKNKNKINIHGFRKGKAPQAMIEKMYGAGIFYEDAANELIPKAYDAEIENCDLDLVSQPKIDVVQIEKGKPFIFTAEVAVKPEVTLGAYEGVEVPKTEINVTDEEVDAEVDKEREKNSRTIAVEDRGVENGDMIKLDFDGSVDGVAFDGGKAENYDLTVGSGSFIPGFEDQLVGVKAGEEKEVKVTFPEDYHAKDLAGKEAVFKCKVNEIKVKELPEANDEFAQDVSEFDTLDELKDDLKKQIAERKEANAKTDFENQIIEQICENMEVEIPECMFTQKCDEMVQDYAYRLQMQGLDLNTYLQYLGQTMDQFKEQFMEGAKQQVKTKLALDAIVKAENIEASEEEIEAEVNKLAEQYNMETDKIKAAVPAEQLSADITTRKAVDFIVDNAVKE